MRRTLLGLLAAVLIASGSTLVATPAQAATKPVTIKKLSTQWIGWDGAAVVKPHVKKAKKVKIVRKAMTVQQGSRVVRRNKTAVKLRPGTYRLTTKVTYKHKGKKRTAVARQKLVVRQGRCATRADYAAIKVSMTAGAGDAVATVARTVHNSGFLASDMLGEMTLGEWRDVIADIDPEAAAAFQELINLYGEDAVMDIGSYTICQNKRKTVDVLYIDGHAIDKAIEDAV